MKFKLEKFHRNTNENELIDDLVQVYQLLNKKGLPITYRAYDEVGKFSSATMVARFGSWNNALIKAQIEINEEKNIADKDLFLNLEKVWTSLGRQPVIRDLVKPLSKYTYQIYSERFGGWRKALKAFVEYVNEENEELDTSRETESELNQKQSTGKRRTIRNISDRMRFRVLARDGFTCQSCGASPIKKRGVELHVDHILPWSNGGETVEENLQTKCKQCNLGKGNAFNQ